MSDLTYHELGTVYGDTWYDQQYGASLGSARVYVPYLNQFVQPKSVLDVGCGRGAWLKAWKEVGTQRLIGLDGYWNSAEKMLDPAIEFRQIDLNDRFCLDQRVDLAMSLEVAEHLEPASGDLFVECLTQTADVVLFSAALSNQGGTNHINEQLHSYWASLFRRRGYGVFDLLRPKFWGDDRICYWYRQNAFLYVNEASTPFQALRGRGLVPLSDFVMMDCVHPVLLDRRSRQLSEAQQLTFTQHVKALPGSLRRALRQRLPKGSKAHC